MNYQKIYFDLISKRKKFEVSKLDYFEIHHIIPKCLGGSNNKNNLIRLTAREHFIAHLLLTRIYKNNLKILYAFMMMKNMNKKSKNKIFFSNNSKLYEKIQSEYSYKRSIKIEYNNEIHTIKEWIKLKNLNISVKSFKDRIKSGWSIDKILSTPKKTTKTIEINDKTYTFKQLAEKLNIVPSRILSRIKDGWEFETALTTPKQLNKKYEFNGEIHTLRQWSFILKIPYNTLYNNFMKTNNLQVAINKILNNKIKIYEVCGNKGTIRELSKIYNINYSTVISRIDKGMKLEEALTLSTEREKKYTVNGETHTIKEWASIININPKALRKRIRDYNGDYIKAITLKVSKRYIKQ